MPSVSPRPEVVALRPDTHGGPDYDELTRRGIDLAALVDFSVNSNPFGPPPAVRQIWNEICLERYPDRECLALRSALADHLACNQDQVWVGNGTAELIWLLALAYLRPGDWVMIAGPTFGEYASAAALMGAQIHQRRARPKHGFRPDSKRLCQDLDRLRPRLCFVCNPNNPTGAYLDRPSIQALLDANPAGLLVLDEAYAPFVLHPWDSLPLLASGRLVVLRSMTKDFALAGLRLGYLLAPPDIVSTMRKVQPPWSVNSVAQQAGITALTSASVHREILTRAINMAAELRQALCALGLEVLPSATHFFLVKVASAAATRAALLEHGVLVRDCTSFGLPQYVRVATHLPSENRKLVDAWCIHLKQQEFE